MCIYGQKQALPDISDLLSQDGLMVFDFHPIHVYLNTENLQRYERTRPLHYQPEALLQERFGGDGARTALKALLDVGI